MVQSRRRGFRNIQDLFLLKPCSVLLACFLSNISPNYTTGKACISATLGKNLTILIFFSGMMSKFPKKGQNTVRHNKKVPSNLNFVGSWALSIKFSMCLEIIMYWGIMNIFNYWFLGNIREIPPFYKLLLTNFRPSVPNSLRSVFNKAFLNLDLME